MDSGAAGRVADLGVGIFLVTVLMCFGAGFLSGYRSGVVVSEQRAVEAGAAKWEVDAKTGQKSFVYVPTQEGR